MPILDIQRRARELGRIRIGQVVPTSNGKTRPEKLDRFRLTSNSRPLLDKVAELYGGTVTEWQPQGGGVKAWEVVTNANRLPIMVPPQPVTQWYEFWTAGGCKHRCDGYTNVLTDEPCDPADPQHRAAIEKPTTRLNVVLRDVEGVGVWRLESHGFNAAVELPDAAEFLAQVGGYVNGWVSLEPRTSIDTSGDKPLTRHFMVPIIEIDVTPAQLMAGHGRVAAPALAGGPVGDTPALAAAGPDYVLLAAGLTDAEDVRNLWRQANAAGHMTAALSEFLQVTARDLEAQAPATIDGPPEGPAEGEGSGPLTDPSPTPDDVVDGVVVDGDEPDPDPDVVWSQIVAAAAAHGLPVLADLETDVATFLGGTTSAEASGAELAAYLEDLTTHPRVSA